MADTSIPGFAGRISQGAVLPNVSVRLTGLSAQVSGQRKLNYRKAQGANIELSISGQEMTIGYSAILVSSRVNRRTALYAVDGNVNHYAVL